MPKPVFAFRLDSDQGSKLRTMAKAYSPYGSGVLLRDMIGAVVSGDPRKIGDFNQRLMDRLTNQMALELVADTKRKVRAMKKGTRRARSTR